MKFYMLAIRDNGDFCDIRKWDDDDCIIKKSRYKELMDAEERYKQYLDSLKDHTLVKDSTLQHLKEVDKKFNETRYEYSKLKIRFMQENLLKFEGGSPIDWACFHITRFLNDYLKEHNVKDIDSITEKRMHTIAFAHALEDKLLDYIKKLEEFNYD